MLGLARSPELECQIWDTFRILKRVAASIQIWTVCLLICTVVSTFAFVRLDVPLALHFSGAAPLLDLVGRGLGARVILSGEALVILTVVLARLGRGHASTFARTLVIACLASMSVYAINDHVLKIFFGVPGPVEIIQGARHGFNIMMGSDGSSFPSGHMALAGGFCGVFMRLYRSSTWPLGALLLLAAGLLIAGDWHFLSDVIAGTFVGTSAGILAGEVWVAHSTRLGVSG